MNFRFKKRTVIIYILLALFLIVDRFFKFLANNGYFDGSHGIFNDFFRLNLAKNYNIAFSLPLSGLFLNITIFFIIILLLFYAVYSLRKGHYLAHFAVFLAFLGAFSNLYDRLCCGYVIDYFDLKYFTVFNLADAMIVIGILGVIFCVGIDNKKKA